MTQEILQQQGTRLKELPPWMSYAAQFEEKLDDKLEQEMNEYAQHRHSKSSSQNEEELARWEEGNEELSKQYQFIHPSEYKDEGPRIGRIIHSSTLINKLRKECGLPCWFRQHPQPRKVTLLVQKDGLAPEVGCWSQLGFMPEYSILKFDKYGVPLDEKMRGWRTCLLQLILKGYLTEETADRVFGKAHGPASTRYLSTLYEFRNRKVEII